MSDDNKLEIKVVATGGEAAAADIAKPTAAIKEQTAAISGLKVANTDAASASEARTRELKMEEIQLRTLNAELKTEEANRRELAALQSQIPKDKWEERGAKIGEGLQVGVVAAGAVALTMLNTIGEENKKQRVEAEEFQHKMEQAGRVSMSADKGGLISQASHLGESIRLEIIKTREETEKKIGEGWTSWLSSNLKEGAKEWWNDLGGDAVGVHADVWEDQKARSAARIAGMEAQQQRDIQKAIALGEQELEILRLKIGGHEAAARQMERELKLKLEIAAIRAEDTGEDYAQKQQRIDHAQDTHDEKQRADELATAAATEKSAQAREAIGRHLAVEAQITALLGEHRAREAGDLRQAATLRESITGILMAQLPPMERLVMLNAALAEGAAKAANSNAADAAHDGAKLEAAVAQREAAQARLADETAAAQIAKIDKQLSRDLANDLRRETPELAEKLKVQRELTAEAQRQFALKKEAEKAGREAERDAKKQEADTAHLEKLRDGLTAAQEKLALDAEGARMTEIHRRADAEIAGIKKQMLPENQAAAIALAQQTAEMEKQLVLQQRFNKDFDNAAANQQKTWQQKSDERQAQHKRDQTDRIVAGKVMDQEDKDRIAGGGLARTAEERQARKNELLDTRGKSKAKQDEADRNDALKRLGDDSRGIGGKDKDFTGEGADFGGGDGGAAQAGQKAAAAAQGLAAQTAQTGAAIEQAMQQAAAFSEGASIAVTQVVSMLSSSQARLAAAEAAIEALQND